MPSGNWSFPCSPRNPAKVREELRLFRTLAPAWRERGLTWSPRSGTQLEFGRYLREVGVGASLPGADEELRFQTQTTRLSDDNLRWTARARFGTYKFFGFVATDEAGYASLTPAGHELVETTRPGETLLRQLLKWQYPDHQHRGRRWPASDFAIFPFVATARLILKLGGLTREEISLHCFTMRRTEDAAAVAEHIRQYRDRRARSVGRTGKARLARGQAEASQARYAAEGRRVVLGSTNDYADALIRAFRFTGLFSVRGSRVVVAAGREAELEELVYRDASGGEGMRQRAAGQAGWGKQASQADRAGQAGSASAPLQLALGEAPPVRLAEPWPLFQEYEDAASFYAYYGAAGVPRLPWEDPARLVVLARMLDGQVAALRAREAHLRSGRSVLSGPQLGETLPAEYDALVRLVDGLRQEKLRLERAIFTVESHTPQRLKEALDYYGPILSREVIDPPTYLEWNTWRVFLALNAAREIVPHLQLDEDLQPLNAAQGNQPDLEVDYGEFLVVAEVTLRTGADQRQAEARPVTRHVLEAQRRYNDSFGGRAERPVYGLFISPRIHPDTVNDFFVALKYRVIERQQIAALPLTFRQFTAALRPFCGSIPFSPDHLRRLLASLVDAALASETGDEWLEEIDAALRRWLALLGAPGLPAEPLARPVPLPLF